MTHIQQRRDPAATWAAENPVLFDGEAGHESDTGKWKLGNGVTAWNDLPYKGGVNSVAGKTGNVTLEVSDVTGAAPTASPVLTGSPTAPTPNVADNDDSIATTKFVKDQAYAPLASPVLTGNPTAPTPATADNDTSIATTAFVKAQFNNTVLTGNPTAPTPATNDNDTSIATTEFVVAAIASLTASTSTVIGADLNVTAPVKQAFRRGPMVTLFVEFTVGIVWETSYSAFVIPDGYRPVMRASIAAKDENGGGTYNWYFGTDGSVKAHSQVPQYGTFRIAITYPRA